MKVHRCAVLRARFRLFIELMKPSRGHRREDPLDNGRAGA
jgi:hypothetical protein